MANTPKVHLATRHNIAACGTRAARRVTLVPSKVTCKACRKSVLMADAEVRQQTEAKRVHTVKEGRA